MLWAALLLMPESRGHPFGLVVSGEPLDLWIRWHPRGKTQDLCIRTGPTSYNQHPTPVPRGRSLAGSCIPALIWTAPKSKGCLPAALRDLRAALLLPHGPSEETSHFPSLGGTEYRRRSNRARSTPGRPLTSSSTSLTPSTWSIQTSI